MDTCRCIKLGYDCTIPFQFTPCDNDISLSKECHTVMEFWMTESGLIMRSAWANPVFYVENSNILHTLNMLGSVPAV